MASKLIVGQKNLDVDWYITLKGKRKRFAKSTKATSDLIAILYEQYQDLRLVYNAINYDEEAKKIVKYYIDNGIYQENIEY